MFFVITIESPYTEREGGIELPGLPKKNASSGEYHSHVALPYTPFSRYAPGHNRI